MSVRREGEAILLEGVCPIEDAETLLQHAQDGASCIDWSGCTHLHAACLQVLLASGLGLCGGPTSALTPAFGQWLAPLLPLANPQNSEA